MAGPVSLDPFLVPAAQRDAPPRGAATGGAPARRQPRPDDLSDDRSLYRARIAIADTLARFGREAPARTGAPARPLSPPGSVLDIRV